ncbi:MAG: bifunctional adenosylcobinamide kinase/adenosylcobinamide-phosphate guanylyltransferase [Eubacteriales bacterium]|nr:bifunctional adenosylcobinamide kinase/adenosylcobinamide-phosphate guanylyltransferase [Eubacteriales bacterium]
MIHLVTGGSGSGKSVYAEEQLLACGEGPRVYVATMICGKDPENIEKIRIHRERRAEMGFETIECPMRLAEIQIPRGANVLLEDLGNLVSNESFYPGGSGIHTVNAILDGLENIARSAANLIIVSNELFSDGIVYDSVTSGYQRTLGLLHQYISRNADKVTEVVYGIPVLLKDDTVRDQKAGEAI